MASARIKSSEAGDIFLGLKILNKNKENHFDSRTTLDHNTSRVVQEARSAVLELGESHNATMLVISRLNCMTTNYYSLPQLLQRPHSFRGAVRKLPYG